MKVYRANKGKKKISAVAICLLLTVVLTIGGTLAYLFTNTDPVTNTFKPARASNNIEETMKGVVKEDVYISVPSLNENPQAVEVFIRVAVVATWQDEAGKIAPATPVENIDYIVAAGSGKWVKSTTDGFYYYTESVVPGGQTDNLFESITVVEGKAPAGHKLHIEIMSQSIQAEGVDKNGVKPVVLAWGVDPSKLN